MDLLDLSIVFVLIMFMTLFWKKSTKSMFYQNFPIYFNAVGQIRNKSGVRVKCRLLNYIINNLLCVTKLLFFFTFLTFV